MNQRLINELTEDLIFITENFRQKDALKFINQLQYCNMILDELLGDESSFGLEAYRALLIATANYRSNILKTDKSSYFYKKQALYYENGGNKSICSHLIYSDRSFEENEYIAKQKYVIKCFYNIKPDLDGMKHFAELPDFYPTIDDKQIILSYKKKIKI